MALLISREFSVLLLPVKCEHFRRSIVNGQYLYLYRPQVTVDPCSVSVCGSVSPSGSNMSQARVTDFFSQKKKGIAGPVKPAKQRSSTAVHRDSSGISTNVSSTRSRSSKNKGGFLCSSSVHEEFVRVIDEAVGLNDGAGAIGNTAKHSPSSPRTPKRTSTDTEFDLGAAVFSATADHSTAKKRRQAEVAAKANVPEKATRRKARKKLVLPQEPPQVSLMLLWKNQAYDSAIFEINVCNNVPRVVFTHTKC